MNQNSVSKKLKILLKVFLSIIVILMLLFGFYRKEYLAQAIPIYVQYLKQKSKWKKVNTGTYAYLDFSLNTIFFIKDNKLVKVFRYGNAWESKYVKSVSNSYLYNRAKTDKDLQCFFNKKEYLIDKKFDAIERLILRDKMLERYASFTDCFNSLEFDDFGYSIKKIFTNDNSYNRYTYTLSYNNSFGYPMWINAKRTNKALIFGTKSYFSTINIMYLVMLPKNTKFTNKKIQDILDYIKKVSNYRVLPVKTLNATGGDLIKSAVIKIEYGGKI